MRKTIFQKALNKWGENNQIKKIQEECLELALAINNMDCPTKSKAESYRNFIEELADVSIMLKQAELIVGKKILKQSILEKLTKLQKHLENGTFKKDLKSDNCIVGDKSICFMTNQCKLCEFKKD